MNWIGGFIKLNKKTSYHLDANCHIESLVGLWIKCNLFWISGVISQFFHPTRKFQHINGFWILTVPTFQFGYLLPRTISFVLYSLKLFQTPSMAYKSTQITSKASKPEIKKKSSKGSASSSTNEFILREKTQLSSLDPIDYYESVCIMIEFIYRHPIVFLSPKFLTLIFLYDFCTKLLNEWRSTKMFLKQRP